ncbi:hypothetical protein XELAEV_18020467mg [Xenopus laevis]|uniref:Uncharacterized protein n=1 Tax=Xenopus laevis TaxID=8355 RepID=A0A974HR12_XENLA|nr:hypothetical protein XELAEV_18020467mg [Xenopus laevis]
MPALDLRALNRRLKANILQWCCPSVLSNVKSKYSNKLQDIGRWSFFHIGQLCIIFIIIKKNYYRDNTGVSEKVPGSGALIQYRIPNV